jgi:F-type H+-transporting ATPase subunit b
VSLSFESMTILLRFQEEGHPAEKFLGLPMPLWQLLNLVLFLAVLVYLVGKPLAAAFRSRQVDIEKRTREAERRRTEVDRLAREIEERTVRLERDIEEIRKQGLADGERARAELAARADEEVARVGREAQEEIARRLAEAKAQLRRSAGDLTTQRAVEILSREINDEDRRRILEDGVQRLRQTPQ